MGRICQRFCARSELAMFEVCLLSDLIYNPVGWEEIANVSALTPYWPCLIRSLRPSPWEARSDPTTQPWKTIDLLLQLLRSIALVLCLAAHIAWHKSPHRLASNPMSCRWIPSFRVGRTHIQWKHIFSSHVAPSNYQCCSSHPPIWPCPSSHWYAFTSLAFWPCHLDTCWSDVPLVFASCSPLSLDLCNESRSPPPTGTPSRTTAPTAVGTVW